MRHKSQGTKCLSQAERRTLAQLIALRGESGVLAELDLGRLPLARLLAGLPVQRATLAIARAGIVRLTGDAPA